MPLPGGLWWLLCCRRGFTLLHRDYGDGELSGDGDEDEDEETFELRTPSPAGGGRVSPGGLNLVSTPLSPYPRPSRRVPLRLQTGCCGRGRGVCLGVGVPGAALPGGARGPRAGCCPPAGAPRREASRVARPGPASPCPAGPGPSPSPSASASAQECGGAGWAARTPGSSPLRAPERRAWMLPGSSRLRDRGKGRPPLRVRVRGGDPTERELGLPPSEDPSTLTPGQNSRPALVSLLGNPKRMGLRNTRLPGCVQPPPRGETEAPLVWEIASPCPPLYDSPADWQPASQGYGLGQAPPPCSGVPSRPGGCVPEWGGLSLPPGRAPAPGGGGGRINIEGGRETGLRLGGLV